MRSIDDLFDNNRAWAQSVKTSDPDFFEKLANQQSPEYLWIGCSDSRVPANQIVGLLPGEVFVHRNVANMVVHTDFNCLTVLQYAVDVLRVKHVLVVGHYNCGGVRAAFENRDNGLIDNWLRNIKDVQQRHRRRIAALESDEERVNLLCELNVISQVSNVCHTTIVQNAWARNQALSVHGWVYSLKDGLIQDLQCTVTGPEQISEVYRVLPDREDF
ncbi:MAG TPA: carbonate dehydratase [Halieaceae bacterium]|uniref:Carbonic anhydrase n=1 Tax=Haliea salexigens TaxID=287487 RepID=A0A3C1KJF0_9GAMM|nr:MULTISPECIES: carbonate dehydratase [Haliea]MCR9186430.1 carbonate dehydratase [Halieaceae bacterium]HAN26593.1 carbonate dehydratase [Haliea salexigens]MAA86278.1 carbonate dehydratase [Haliea sp.]MAD62255.1 carbonate dehydratase [Haliea sp.]MAY93740.1 carbonate dehydratase [Haliea sp.]